MIKKTMSYLIKESNRNLVVIGASGHGKVVADIAKSNDYTNIIFLDDDISKKNVGNYLVLGTTDDVDDYINDYDFIVAIGDNEIRKRITIFLEKKEAKFPILVHKTAIIGSEVEIGNGTVVMPSVVVNASTKIGKHCIINTSSSIDHDNIIENYVHISPGVHTAGNVHIGENTWIGIGSTVINNVSIESNVIIGAGSVVVKNIENRGIYVGVPTRRIHQ